MIVAIIDTCDLTRYLHYTIIKSIDSNSHVYKYKSIEQFLDDMINPKIKLPDYILTAYNVCSLNAMNLINSVEEFRLKNKYLDKLNTYIVSSNIDIPSLHKDLETKKSFKGYLIKPMREDQIIPILNQWHLKHNSIKSDFETNYN